MKLKTWIRIWLHYVLIHYLKNTFLLNRILQQIYIVYVRSNML